MPSDGVHSLQTRMSTMAPVSAAVPVPGAASLDHAVAGSGVLVTGVSFTHPMLHAVRGKSLLLVSGYGICQVCCAVPLLGELQHAAGCTRRMTNISRCVWL